ncbi:LPXTG cell wall anchor domain-containing protein [Streptococcus sp. X16XC17]|nr:LPXTG cell wall anchor domain-containing protein [Streptococcus sp. X16XC17]
MLGDFNDYEFNKTIQIIETGGMNNLVSRHDAADRFSYFYQGNNQSLDNLLVSGNLLNSYSFDMIHVNSAFMEKHGRASDHDPLLVQLSFTNQVEPKDHQSGNQPMPPSADEKNGKPQGDIEKSMTGAGSARVTPSNNKLPKTGQTISYALVATGIVLLTSSVYIFNKRQSN